MNIKLPGNGMLLIEKACIHARDIFNSMLL